MDEMRDCLSYAGQKVSAIKVKCSYKSLRKLWKLMGGNGQGY